MAKIVVGMSGGVDSAVSAKILKDQGHEVIGVFMRNWDSAANNDILGNPKVRAKICPEEQDWKDVLVLSKQIGIEVKRVDFVKEYWDDVFTDLIDQYKKGRTPNPDILCNKYVKFGAFYKWVFKNIPNVDFIATGHYANLENKILKKPFDKNKDQTYFLAQVPAENLKRIIFPLSKLPKEEVRKIAKENNLIVANKKDSTGICFIGERDFALFLQNYIPNQPGNIIDIKTNKILGRHIGAMYYTIGQRKGLKLGGMPEPYYVAGHNLDKKEIYVAPLSDKSWLTSNQALITDVNWFNKDHQICDLEVKFRYKSKSIKATIKFVDQDIMIFYPEGFEAVTPGQQAVFYDKDICLGGGIIDKVYDSNKKKTYL